MFGLRFSFFYLPRYPDISDYFIYHSFEIVSDRQSGHYDASLVQGKMLTELMMQDVSKRRTILLPSRSAIPCYLGLGAPYWWLIAHFRSLRLSLVSPVHSISHAFTTSFSQAGLAVGQRQHSMPSRLLAVMRDTFAKLAVQTKKGETGQDSVLHCRATHRSGLHMSTSFWRWS